MLKSFIKIKTNKKAVLDFMLNYLMAVGALFIIISFFMFYFLVLGGSDSKPVIINAEEIQSSSKLINLLNTNISEIYPEKKEFANMDFYDLLAKAYESGNKEDAKKFRELLEPLLNTMRSTTPYKETVGWHFLVYTKNYNLINSLSISPIQTTTGEILLSGIEASESSQESPVSKIDSHFLEWLLVPTQKGNLKLEIYFACKACKPEILRGYI